MKYLLILALVVLAGWLWRTGRRDLPGPGGASPPPPPGPQEMVRCAHCGVHLPRADAVVGRLNLYCSAEHRDAAEA
jgi:uncharacterized protein